MASSTNDRLMIREIDRMATSASAAELEKEIQYIDTNRRKCLERMNSSMAEIVRRARHRYSEEEIQNLRETLELLSLITTQEEERHMLQTRHLIVLGRVVRRLAIDPAESGLDDVLFAARARWGR